MLSSSRTPANRRGIVLVLVLAMLGLLALVGITFATFSGQARINSKNFMLSLYQPQADELIDFGLAQLITDTNDIRSVIHGHSMARDMFGNDAFGNGYLPISPSTGAPFSITNVTATGIATTNGALYDLTTNILSTDPTFYGYNFTRWTIRVAYAGTLAATGPLTPVQPVTQTFEVIVDNTANANRIFRVNITTTDAGTDANGLGPTILSNPTLGTVTQLPGFYLAAAATTNAPPGANTFSLDGRWLHAFNGTGMGSRLASTGYPASYYPNFRYNGGLVGGPNQQPPLGVPGPGAVGMDEDYDACDLENWFLAIQSADGQVMIPSFHRPAIIRVDFNNNVNDWLRQNQANPNPPGGPIWADSAARFLRPCQADGHDAATFPDLYPDSITGKMPYDVDNDGDGVTDSVWLDLGYPARRDSSGRLFKPLFAFMVIGLNGRIPLNTAGNLAGTVGGIQVPPNPGVGVTPVTAYAGASQALHLGNSVSEVDPTYALQNGFNPNGTGDPNWAFAPPGFTIGGALNFTPAANTQVDAGGIDVRLTQLRNLLAGTRPQNNPSTYDPTTNGDGDYVLAGATNYYMPNGIANLAGVDTTLIDPNTQLPYLVRSTTPVPGRWGEAQSIPGTPFANPLAATNATLPAFVNVVGSANSNPALPPVIVSPYSNPVRAGYSLNITDIINGLPRDVADDNFNTYDPIPVTTGRTGEVGDADLYDVVGALVFPVERMRRWLTPADINGTGSVNSWNAGAAPVNHGYDNLGRVEFFSYFRPPGSPGVITTNYTVTPGTGQITITPFNNQNPGSIWFPSITPPAPDPFYTSGPSNNPPFINGPAGNPAANPMPVAYPTYLPDMTNNPLHGFESFRFPNQNYPPNAYAYPTTAVNPSNNFGGFTPQSIGGSPADMFVDVNDTPIQFPTYDFQANAQVHSDGLNDADETNLYSPNPLLDSPFGPGDLEWLYRQQDVDGVTLQSRLAQLAPMSFSNTIDGQRRRRLFALDSWDLNNFVWSNDNPGGVFSSNSRFYATNPVPPLVDPATGRITDVTNASFTSLSATRNVILPTPTLAHRDKKINLNYPLPVSNDPNEPVRQKWISDTYQLLKWVLPPKAVDTPEELAQLSQFVINIVDFRDPDCTMTHWVNPDVSIAGVLAPTVTSGIVPPPTTAVTLVPSGAAAPITVPPTQVIPLEQYGMEYNPVALNEVLAYSFQYIGATGGSTPANRFFAELVNTQTSPELALATTFNPALDLGGFVYTPNDPYSGGSWDLVFTADDPYSRPDPYRGQLVPYANLYGLTPLNKDSFNAPNSAPPAPPGSDVILMPLGQSSTIPGITASAPIPNPNLATGTTLATDYYYVFGNLPPSSTTGAMTTYYENGTPSPTTPLYYPFINAAASTYATPNATTPSLIQTLATTLDPLNTAGGSLTTSPIPIYQGVLPWQSVVVPAVTTAGAIPNTTTVPVNYQTKVPTLAFTATGARLAKYYWVCLRRPANPFAPVSISNPMVVVDSVRFPYADGTGQITTDAAGNPATKAPYNTLYSVQRFQPYRGGHAVPVPTPAGGGGGGGGVTSTPVDPRYGYTEQIVVPTINNIMAGGAQTYGIYYSTAAKKNPATAAVYHTLGWANEYEQGSTNPQADPWDYFPFHDRDFTSVAELMLVPGCPPGLFTKQFVEFAPSQANAGIFTTVMPLATPPVTAVPWPTPQLSATVQGGAGGGGTPGGPAAGTAVEAYYTASTPLLYTNGYAATAPFGANTPYQPHTFPYLNDEFFYSGFGGLPTIDATGQVGGYAADGWFKMFEFFEVPSQAFGAIGPVASGANFDWLRQDIKPGQLNLNMIIDEEVFMSLTGKQNISQSNVQITDAMSDVLVPSDQFTEQMLNFDQIAPLGPIPGSNPASWNYKLPVSTPANPAFMLPVGANPIPLVVTSTLANGTPASAYPLAASYSFTGGLLDQDQITNTVFGTSNNMTANPMALPPIYNNALKAAWVQFLTLRHGGSGYLFGFGTGAVGQNYAVNPVTPPQALPLANSLYGTGIPAERPFHSLSYPDIDYTIMRPAALPPSAYTNPVYNGNPTVYTATIPPTPPTYYAGDPGVRNPTLFLPYPTSSGIPSGTAPNFPGTLPTGYTPPLNPPPLVTPWGVPYDPVYPSAIPVRRLFQLPDVYTGSATAVPPLTVPNGPSNAGETGDPYINNQSPINATGAPLNVPYSAPGAFQPPIVTFPTVPLPTVYTEILTNSVVNLYQPGKNGTILIDPTTMPPTIVNVNSPNGTVYLGSNGADKRQHPYWRTEQLQRVMNLTTTRTHQYAVWITIGFFEVKRQGDLGMLSYNPQLAFDILGPEIGAANGKNIRYRGFYLVDRLQLTGFNPASRSAFRSAVVYRQRIQ